jgi:hypothetical protein
MPTALPPQVTIDINAFHSATGQIAAYAATQELVTTVVRRLAQWSVDQAPPLALAENDSKAQFGVAFTSYRPERSLWKAYPASKGVAPKLEIVPRAGIYLTPVRLKDFHHSLTRCGVPMPRKLERKVPTIALAALADEGRFQALLSVLDWARLQPELNVEVS